MSKFLFTTDAESEVFCLGIADNMIRRFGISEDEAIGRINKQLQNLKEWTGDNSTYYHRTIEEWANDIYYKEDYENNSLWWIKDSNPEPKSYP